MQTIATQSARDDTSSSRVIGSSRRSGFSLRLLGGLLAASVLAFALHHSQRQLATTVTVPDEESTPVYLPDARFLRLVSLGYENVVADVLWFRTINYFGKHFRSDRLYPWLAHMCDLVTDLDPRAKHVYRFGGLLLPWEADRPDDGIALLKKGIEVFPDSWNLHFTLGFNYFFFKHDVDAALPYVRRAAELPSAHPFVSRFAALMYAEQSGPETAREFLKELEATGGQQMRDVIEQRLLELELGQKLGELEAALAVYRDRFGRYPAALDELVREGILESIEPDPFGESYVYDPDAGKVSSGTGHRPLQLYVSPNRKRVLRSEGGRD